LEENYLSKGKLGTKCSLGGLYPPASPENTQTEQGSPHLLVLDVGLASATSATSIGTPAGEILSLAPDGDRIQHKVQTVVPNQLLPDGITIDRATNRIFWTNMGIPGRPDGTVCSSNMDGSDIRTLIETGAVNTPKQIAIDAVARKLYFCDREGCAVYRCKLDGSDLEPLVSRQPSKEGSATDVQDWCVGVAVSPQFKKFYWTQKGAPKSGRGRILCAGIDTPPGSIAAEDKDEELCILSGLPEPIDLEIDEERGQLYWTDRGELPWGNALYRIQLDREGRPVGKPEILVRGLHEAIGLSLSQKSGDIYLTDLGGSVYRFSRDGKKQVLYREDGRAFTGVLCLE
jgi:sugar lactone lactonase YvrE